MWGGRNVRTMIDVFVGQIMTEDLVTIDPSQTLADAGETMTDANVKSVVVSDAEDHPVGILTSTDFVRAAADGNIPGEIDVSEYMTADIVTTTTDTPVNDAADRMVDHDISHLPVVREDGRLRGIVTKTDVAAYVSGLDEVLEA
jgi:CBS domain-containing protein